MAIKLHGFGGPKPPKRTPRKKVSAPHLVIDEGNVDQARQVIQELGDQQSANFLHGLNTTEPPPHIRAVLDQMGLTPDDIRRHAQGMFGGDNDEE